MFTFNCDYTEGAHPRILQKMLDTNLEQTVGYGEDAYCAQARQLIRQACGREDVDVHFLVGGTQANFTVIRTALRPDQGVVCPVTGHINGHETGAVEATGPQGAAPTLRPRGKTNPGNRWTLWCRPIGPTRPGSTWCSPKWCTSATPRKTARCTP